MQEETRQLYLHKLELERAAAEAAVAGPVGADDIDTDDEAGEEAEYEAWKLRELARIAADREEREREAREAAERERLKTMTEEERRQWERENPKVRPRRWLWTRGCKHWRHGNALFLIIVRSKSRHVCSHHGGFFPYLSRGG